MLGNHEFDHGIDGLLPYLERLNAPMLGANVNTELEPEMTPYVKNHVIVNRKGRRIGIIGVLLQQVQSLWVEYCHNGKYRRSMYNAEHVNISKP